MENLNLLSDFQNFKSNIFHKRIHILEKYGLFITFDRMEASTKNSNSLIYSHECFWNFVSRSEDFSRYKEKCGNEEIKIRLYFSEQWINRMFNAMLYFSSIQIWFTIVKYTIMMLYSDKKIVHHIVLYIVQRPSVLCVT